MLYATFNRFEIGMSADDARMGSHQGECQYDVEQLVADPAIAEQLDAIGPEPIRQELAEYGAWDDVELADDAANRERIVWIACGNIVEELPC
jgi:hypothetical protein